MKNKLFAFFAWIKSFFTTLSSVFSAGEKIIVCALVLVLIVSGTVLLRKNYLDNTKEVANYGGTYEEGIVVKNKDELTGTVNRLTKIGLTAFDNNGNIIPEVAESWEVSEDTTTYTFTIRSGFSRDEIIKTVEKQKDIWPSIQIAPEGDNKIVFKFPQSYSPFLASTTEPILPYGPYKLLENDSAQMIFLRNDDFYKGKPYLDKIVIKIYPSNTELVKAYKAKDINGVYYVENAADYKQLDSYNFSLPRYNMIFFNTAKDVFKEKDVRKNIAEGKTLEQPIKIVLVSLDNEKNRQIVADLQTKWQAQNITMDVYYKSAEDIINNIIPARDYDVLVYGLDYGVDPDPYPFWHSTQAVSTGLNLSNFSNIDADVALEEARKTSDQKTRQEKYDEFWRIFKEEVPAIIVSQDQWTFGASNKYHGVTTGYTINPEDRFLNIKDWYLKTKRVDK